MLPGSDATFSVTASGSGQLSYQWQRSDDGGLTWIDVPGATAATAIVAAAQSNDDRAHLRVVISNALGSMTSNDAQLRVASGPPRLAMGLSVAVARLADGSMRSWGTEFTGELGDGGAPTDDRDVPGSLPGTGVAQISSGSKHSVAVQDTGAVLAWGFNSFGQLGQGNQNDLVSPTTIPGIAGAVRACAGGAHTLVLLNNGTVVAMGNNTSGQLGLGASSGTVITMPQPVNGLSNAIALACGSTHSVALLSDGTVRTWGRNNKGQLGDGSAVNQSSPVAVAGLTGVVAIAAGFEHTLALRGDGTVWSWGANAKGQLGDASTTDRPTPVAVSGIADAVRIAAGGQDSMALPTNGVPMVWGSNAFGELGNGTAPLSPSFAALPTTTPGLGHIIDIAVGHHPDRATLFAVVSDGTVRGWGNNTEGQVGAGSPNPLLASPTTVNTLNVD
ncbi:MAG TPA: hypothetical protein VFU71_10145 [Burkholderiaceae bacterium]|nr:hypothetical protein [Burkholderiaceae bacterium]